MKSSFNHGWSRRHFLEVSTAATLGLFLSRLSALAGSSTRTDFDRLIPTDKALSPDWVKSLFARGAPEVLRGTELKFVGMPVGGIGAGQLYLGGDGQLWHWDIFNALQELPAATGGSEHYRQPPAPASPLQQKFSLKIGDTTRTLNRDGFSEISFRGEYPVGIVEYADPASPVALKLEAFSPFIPLNTDDSSLPATVLQFTLRNLSEATVDAEISGELENAVCLNNRSQSGVLRNQVVRDRGLTTLHCFAEGSPALANLPDFGTMSLSLLGKPADVASADATAPFTARLSGVLGRKVKLKPGASVAVTFIIAWRFPNLSLDGPLKNVGRFYATKFDSAHAVAEYVAKNHDRLASQTKLWRDTWYDSTLPFWFLDRTFLNTSTLATSTTYRFANGRYYGWEGVGRGHGTCSHVYHYAHAAARLFPDLERTTREKIDFGLALLPDGAISFRAEFTKTAAVDGQAGTILRALREHQMSADREFLQRNWPKIKLATQWLIAKDANNDGLIESDQHNTLDQDWFGPVAWLSGLYLASLLAAAEMANEVGDSGFSEQCRSIFETGRKNFVAQLFDGEYFVNRVDPNHLEEINSGTGCEIDQVFGQSWAFQVGLPRVLPKEATLSALKSLWRYNFAPDVGPYREHNKPGRWYATAGEAGLLMCTFPRSDWDYAQARGKGKADWAAGYFNECMNGFEHQVASHMIWEGMTLEGFAIERALHDRYHASKRNPWNEIEYGDHYVRSMASYGVFLAACGFEYHGSRMHLGFAPKVSPENFKCAFTSAEGWGSYRQKIEGGRQQAEIAVQWGRLKLKTIAFESESEAITSAGVTLDGRTLSAGFHRTGKRILISLDQPAEIASGKVIQIAMT
jgi:non-lysosomal glucosylceramidase